MTNILCNLRTSVLTEEEITAAYKNARELLLEGSVEAKRRLISLYLDKVLVFDDYVEMYLGALPLYIREKLIKKYRNPSENTEIAEIFGKVNRFGSKLSSFKTYNSNDALRSKHHA